MKLDYIFARSEGLASGDFFGWNAGRSVFVLYFYFNLDVVFLLFI